MGFNTGCRITSTTTPVRDSICDLLKRIDQMQKEAIVSEIQGRCDSCVLPIMFNTKPIAIWTACGRFEAVLPMSSDPANLFRVEEVRDCDTVLLRILKVCGDKIHCTDCTLVLRIDCICAIQCFDAIHCHNICIKGR